LALPGTESRVKVATFWSSPGTGSVAGSAVVVLSDAEIATLPSSPGTGWFPGDEVRLATGVFPTSFSELARYCGVCTAMK
jgi:hypothetical protein